MAVTVESGIGADRRSTMDVAPMEAIRSVGRPSSRSVSWVRHAALGDGLAVVLAAFAAALTTHRWLPAADAGTHDLVGPAIVATWPILLGLSSGYSLKASLSSIEEVRRILETAVRLLAGLGIVHILAGVTLPRTYLLLALPTTILLTLVCRVAVRSRLSRANTEWHSYRLVAIGPSAEIVRFCRDLDSSRTGQVQVVAYVADDIPPGAPVPRDLQLLRRLPDRSALPRIRALGVEADALVRVGRPEPDEMWALGRRAYDMGMTVAIAPAREDATTSMATTYLPLGPTPLLVVETPTLRPLSAAAKSAFDRVMALGLLVLLSPALLTVAAVIAVRDGRPILFRQERVGRDGSRFTCLKFRTMVPDAEARLEELRAGNQAGGPLFKLHDDPRVTPTGRWLRRYSLDELPQLINVLRGDMSIVGPRPPLPCEVETYDVRTARRLLVKPGITGLWQTQGRSDLGWDDSVSLDLMYIDHWSPLLDLVTLVRTVKTVLRPSGAY